MSTFKESLVKILNKVKELVKDVKVLQWFIVGLMLTAVFTILLPTVFSAFPAIFIAAIASFYSRDKITGKYNWYYPSAVLVGALYIWILSL